MDYRRYFTQPGSLSERNFAVWTALKTRFIRQFERVLFDYNWLECVKQARQNQHRLRILVLGADEGAPAIFMAEYLKELGLLETVLITTIDGNPGVIENAERESQRRNLTANLDFYVYDLALPLSNCEALKLAGEACFDVVFSFTTLQQMPGAKSKLADIYQLVKPGGIIWLGAFVLNKRQEGTEVVAGRGWYAPHPVLEPFLRAWSLLLGFNNPASEVGLELGKWLSDLGAVGISYGDEPIPVGGDTSLGVEVLRFLITVMLSLKEVMVETGLLTLAQYNQMVEEAFQVLSRETCGGLDVIVTWACKA
jgi:SAM-dependent methyltransferase